MQGCQCIIDDDDDIDEDDVLDNDACSSFQLAADADNDDDNDDTKIGAFL